MHKFTGKCMLYSESSFVHVEVDQINVGLKLVRTQFTCGVTGVQLCAAVLSLAQFFES